MRIPISWLRELVDVDASTEELAERLSLSGTSVESIERLGGDVRDVVVGRLLEVAEIPEARKPMWHATVDAGEHGRFEVVAGAPVASGEVVPFAKPGSRVTTVPELGVRTMLGRYESQGMLCSAHELGLGDDHSGILKLDPHIAPGTDVAALLGLDDEVLELEITPNRPDLYSVRGVAREVAVLFGVPLRGLDASVEESGDEAVAAASVTIEDPEGCPRYLGRVVTEVVFGPSPAPIQARLHACGVRPLGNLVDATNYVLELTGQPLHAFDLDTLAGHRVVVRRARSGERLVTLDDVERKLEETDLVIADAERPQALAGIMGGADSEVGPSTSRVLIEAAYFEPRSVYRTGRRVGLSTGASQRFEKGTDPEMVGPAAAMCAALLRRWAGGAIARGAIDVGSAPARPTITLRRERVDLVIGTAIDDAEQDRILAGLGADVEPGPSEALVRVPSWRPDLEREIDLIEEVARIHGYDRVPMRVPTGQRGRLTDVQQLRRRVRDVLLGAGLSEATLTSFVADEDLERFGGPAAVVITNPLTADQGHLRPSLLPGLLRAAQRNRARGVDVVRLFEMGTVFGPWSGDSEGPLEVEHLGGVLSGPAEAAAWSASDRIVDVYDAKGIVELVLAELGRHDLSVAPSDHPVLHPGRAATVTVDGEAVGVFGEIRPTVAAEADLPDGAVVFELALPPLFAGVPTGLVASDVPHLPPVLRDLNLVCDEAVPAAQVRGVIVASGGEWLESATLVDVYRGAPVPDGRRSLVWRLVFRASDRTLLAEEADAARDAIVAAARERLDADLR